MSIYLFFSSYLLFALFQTFRIFEIKFCRIQNFLFSIIYFFVSILPHKRPLFSCCQLCLVFLLNPTLIIAEVSYISVGWLTNIFIIITCNIFYNFFLLNIYCWFLCYRINLFFCLYLLCFWWSWDLLVLHFVAIVIQNRHWLLLLLLYKSNVSCLRTSPLYFSCGLFSILWNRSSSIVCL